jgi:hypothetical protein
VGFQSGLKLGFSTIIILNPVAQVHGSEVIWPMHLWNKSVANTWSKPFQTPVDKLWHIIKFKYSRVFHKLSTSTGLIDLEFHPINASHRLGDLQPHAQSFIRNHLANALPVAPVRTRVRFILHSTWHKDGGLTELKRPKQIWLQVKNKNSDFWRVLFIQNKNCIKKQNIMKTQITLESNGIIQYHTSRAGHEPLAENEDCLLAAASWSAELHHFWQHNFGRLRWPNKQSTWSWPWRKQHQICEPATQEAKWVRGSFSPPLCAAARRPV